MAPKAFAPHPALKYIESGIENFKARTGHSIDEWVAITTKAKLPDRKARIAWLRNAHKLGLPSATAIADSFEGKSLLEYDPEAYVEKMFSGSKAALRPLYEDLLKLSYGLGKDVTATPCATMVPIRRKHVIAQIKPATNTRIDFGLALKDTVAEGKLIDTGGRAKGDRITHRIAVSSKADINAELKRWLRVAYDMNT